jgi:hypothetical protein
MVMIAIITFLPLYVQGAMGPARRRLDWASALRRSARPLPA